ncbi:MAG TPA: hypothetical protein DCG69_00740 [Bacteroidales bacterium]|nr:hypothetical protein [Bacteroidales bacterium]
MNLKKSKSAIIFLFAMLALLACKRNQFKIDLSKTEKEPVEIYDYGKALFSLNRDSLPSQLKELQKQYALFLGTEPMTDEQIIQLDFYINDVFLNDLFKLYQSTFPSLKPLKEDLSLAFQHLRYYYPNTKSPEVYAYISGIQDPVIFQDNILVLGLDNYLGESCEIYARIGVPKYKMKSMNPSFVVRDVISAMSLEKMPRIEPDASVLEQMIFEGKRMFFIKSMMPEIKDSVLLSFSDEQLAWFEKNESELWKYYIEYEVLFKTDYESMKKFINEAPFTSVLGNDSPSRTGVWLGYQIVLAYAKNSKENLPDILSNTNAKEILNKSKYRPGK